MIDCCDVMVSNGLALNISKVLRELPEYSRAKRIACYLHMDHGEVETSTIISNAFKDGKRIYLPRIVKLHHQKQYEKERTELDMIEIGSMEEIDSLVPHGPFKLREPHHPGRTCFDDGGLDLIILPGMAFTKDCKRLGHGKGFYDCFLGRHDEWSAQNNIPIPFKVAIGAREQLVDDIPLEHHDRIMDSIVVDTDLFRP